MTTSEPPLSAPPASSQALPADQDTPCRAAAVPSIPGFAWAYTVTSDGDTHWLECDFCSEPVKAVEAGDSLEAIVTRARDHERICHRPTAPAAAPSVPTRACGWSGNRHAETPWHTDSSCPTCGAPGAIGADGTVSPHEVYEQASSVPTGTRDRCSCCQRMVSPLDADGRCGHCGPNRARSHVDDKPCAPSVPTGMPEPAPRRLPGNQPLVLRDLTITPIPGIPTNGDDSDG